MVIAVDFDGTLCEDAFPEIGKPHETLINDLKRCRKENGDKLILWTCRCGEYLDKAVEWCKEQGLEFDAVNENVPWIGFYSRKVCADVYIDDLAVGKDDWMMKLNSIYEDTKLRERFRGGPCEV